MDYIIILLLMKIVLINSILISSLLLKFTVWFVIGILLFIKIVDNGTGKYFNPITKSFIKQLSFFELLILSIIFIRYSSV